MGTPRLDMARIKEILRLKFETTLTHRQVASSLGVSAGSVGGVIARAKAVGLTLEDIITQDEAELDIRLYGDRSKDGLRTTLPAGAWIHTELKRLGVTRALLHLEYLEEHPAGCSYTTFCDHYRRWKEAASPSMKQVHRAGEKMFVDYSGKRPRVVDPSNGEERFVELYVATLGASNKTFAIATESQRLPDWIFAHVKAFEYFGGVVGVTVPDQLKSGVRGSCSYEPLTNRTYADCARHYGTVVIPARPLKPKDKAKAEVAVQIAQRWILARVRNETFSSLAALNRRIAELLEDLNNRPMKKYGGESRNELFERIEKAHLKPLPSTAFEYGEWKHARVGMDYHVTFDGHSYSVPYRLVKERVEIRATRTAIQVFRGGKRVASHARGAPFSGSSTASEHMPASHRAHSEWTPNKLVEWGNTVGRNTGALVQLILSDRPHPEMGYRSCLGLQALERTYGKVRLEQASSRAVGLGVRSYRHVATMLKNGLEAVDENEDDCSDIPPHENVRGSEYYH